VTRQAAFDRGQRGLGTRSVRPAALGEIGPAAPAFAAQLGDAGLDQLDRGLAGSAREDCARNRSKRLQELDQIALLPSR
jgi:hypothetical protein